VSNSSKSETLQFVVSPSVPSDISMCTDTWIGTEEKCSCRSVGHVKKNSIPVFAHRFYLLNLSARVWLLVTG